MGPQVEKKIAVEQWNSWAADNLRQVTDNVANASPPEQVGTFAIAFRDLNDDAGYKIKAATAEISQDRAIYIITLDEHVGPAELILAFEQARGSSRDAMKLPQFNGDEQKGQGSEVLYVGSSYATQNRKKTTYGRLRQHLITAPKGTYALNLSQWAAEVAGGIVVTINNYPKETPRSVVVTVEDVLSQELLPLFGRRGTQR